MFNRKFIFKWWIFHWYLRLHGGTLIPLFLRTILETFSMFSIQVGFHEVFNKYLGSTYPTLYRPVANKKGFKKVSLAKM